MPERTLSERIETTAGGFYVLQTPRWVKEQVAALEAENARLLGIEEQLQGIIRAQLAEINHHMDENARLRKVYEEVSSLVYHELRTDHPLWRPLADALCQVSDA